MVRGRLLVETPEQIQIIRHEISDLQDSLSIVKVKDFMLSLLKRIFERSTHRFNYQTVMSQSFV